MQDIATSYIIVAFVVVMDAAADDFVRFEFENVTAIIVAIDATSNKNIIIMILISPADLGDFLE